MLMGLASCTHNMVKEIHGHRRLHYLRRPWYLLLEHEDYGRKLWKSHSLTFLKNFIFDARILLTFLCFQNCLTYLREPFFLFSSNLCFNVYFLLSRISFNSLRQDVIRHINYTLENVTHLCNQKALFLQHSFHSHDRNTLM